MVSQLEMVRTVKLVYFELIRIGFADFVADQPDSDSLLVRLFKCISEFVEDDWNSICETNNRDSSGPVVPRRRLVGGFRTANQLIFTKSLRPPLGVSYRNQCAYRENLDLVYVVFFAISTCRCVIMVLSH